MTALPIGTAPIPASLRDDLRSDMGELLADLRRFVDRRISELSVELHGAVQIVDFTEANLTEQLGRIHEQVAGLIAVPAAATRNSGIELEAVVQATEAAAHRIMEAAEAIGDWLRAGGRDAASFDQVSARVSAIFEACAFQDLTSQRIRRAIGHLQALETLLDGMMARDGEGGGPSPGTLPPGADLAQTEIDRLLG